ncbi:hypothetical protein LTR62_002565 [Meristemomyces frigidus]|uniref:Prokaryotic-type class I peptide chain release factors domain-containing protein n=1 Tax=Meristemomyces frigidus TaxID=1508187 RepID=A0AAN7TSQ9_9PEZI|nr:hypothetical protein LTR62_002565 [Meristemomyces frigidus]
MRYNAMLRHVILPGSTTSSKSLCVTRALATKRSTNAEEADEAELAAARKWLANLNPDTIPRNLCDITFSRSSGPGGQNVNKVSSKTTLRLPTTSLLPLLPPLLHPAVLASRYYAPNTSSLVLQADESRKQGENVTACFRRLHEVILQAGREVVPGETSVEQRKRVEGLQKAEAAGRRRMKEFQSKKKSARRGGGGGRDE